MAKTTLWVLPDLYGSHLYWSYAHGFKHVWLDLPALRSGGLDDSLRLPGPQLGGAINAGAMIDGGSYAQIPLVAWLKANLPDDWSIVPWPYDWRGGAQTLGQLLANNISVQPNPANGHRLLGLGYGGLVACAAYGALVDLGKANLVPRVVTLGAPLAGTYGVVETWRFEHSPVNTLLNYQVGQFDQAGLGSFPFQRLARDVATFVTWPSTYDLLPDPTAWDDPADQFRSMVWQATNWSSAVVPPSATLLSASQTGFRAWINANNRWPPPGVLVCGVGMGRRTPLRLVPPSPNATEVANRFLRGGVLTAGLLSAGVVQVLAARAQLPGLAYDLGPGLAGGAALAALNGDGVAAPQSQMRPGVQYVSCDGDHQALLSHPTIRDNLIAMLSGPGTPAGPLDATTLPDWPSTRTEIIPRAIAPNVPRLPRAQPSIF